MMIIVIIINGIDKYIEPTMIYWLLIIYMILCWYTDIVIWYYVLLLLLC